MSDDIERGRAREAIKSIASVIPVDRHEAFIERLRRCEQAEIEARERAAQEWLRRNGAL